jgi:hypothetical protein
LPGLDRGIHVLKQVAAEPEEAVDGRDRPGHGDFGLRWPASRIAQIVRGQRAITPETALRLARYFGGSAAIWLRLQIAYDLSRAEATLAAKIAAEITPPAA